MLFQRRKSGILAPAKSKSEGAFGSQRALKCHYCPRPILKSQEPGGTLKTRDGHPICRICRATKASQCAKDIAAGKQDWENDRSRRKVALRQMEVSRANERVLDVAAESIIKTNTQNPNIKEYKRESEVFKPKA
jgi:hypothetical protein